MIQRWLEKHAFFVAISVLALIVAMTAEFGKWAAKKIKADNEQAQKQAQKKYEWQRDYKKPKSGDVNKQRIEV